jgi:GBP family porin
MNKTMIALAVATASSSALAQSQIQIYGVVDAGYQYNSMDRAGALDVSGIVPGHRNQSRLGFRGNEDLGDGLSALFQLESGFTIDTGQSTQGGRLFGRQAWAGLDSTRLGRVAMGRVGTFGSGTGAFDMMNVIDPFQNGFGLASVASVISENGIRLDNMVAYRSPKLGAFQLGYQHSFQQDGTEAAGTSNNRRADSFGVNFASGPLYAAVTYLQLKYPNATAPAAKPQDQKSLQIGATYDLSVVKLHGLFAKEDNVSAIVPLSMTGINGRESDAKAWMVGIHVPFGPNASKFVASYQERDGDAVALSPTTRFEGDLKVYAFAYEYWISRRTALHLSVGVGSGDKSLDKDALPAYPGSGTAVVDGVNRKQYTVAMTHFF